jgi:hypothetical protein
MKKSFEIKPMKTVNTLIQEGKFYAKNESNRALNFAKADPLASCWAILNDNQSENKVVLQ